MTSKYSGKYFLVRYSKGRVLIMKIRQSSKSSLFLIELIIAIFFFIIAATICIQLFVKSYTISNETISINHAVLWTQNLAEIFTNQNGDYEILQEIYAESDCIEITKLHSEKHMLLLFDSNWYQTNDTNKACYYVLSSYSQDNQFRYQDIYVMPYRIDISTITDANELIDNEAMISHQQIQCFVSTSNVKE